MAVDTCNITTMGFWRVRNGNANFCAPVRKRLTRPWPIKPSSFCEHSTRHPYLLPAPAFPLKSCENYLKRLLLDPIVWLSSFHKEPEFSLARPARAFRCFFSQFLRFPGSLGEHSPIIEPGIDGEATGEFSRSELHRTGIHFLLTNYYFRLSLGSRAVTPDFAFTKNGRTIGSVGTSSVQLRRHVEIASGSSGKVSIERACERRYSSFTVQFSRFAIWISPERPRTARAH